MLTDQRQDRDLSTLVVRSADRQRCAGGRDLGSQRRYDHARRRGDGLPCELVGHQFSQSGCGPGTDGPSETQRRAIAAGGGSRRTARLESPARQYRLTVTWHAEDCVVPEDQRREENPCLHGLRRGYGAHHYRSREGETPRLAIKAKRRRCGKKCKPLPPRKHGSDNGLEGIQGRLLL